MIGESDRIIKPILCVGYFEYRLQKILHAFSLIGPDPVNGPFGASHGQRRREIWLMRKILKINQSRIAVKFVQCLSPNLAMFQSLPSQCDDDCCLEETPKLLLQETVSNTILITDISNSNNLNKF